MIIPIGLQCTGAEFLKANNCRSEAFPFDHMFATPEFVYKMLVLLLEINMDIRELVNNHFFLCEKKASSNSLENYVTDKNGIALFNTKYNAIFPHDEYTDKSREKYYRRFLRLKGYIYNKRENLNFMYISQASFENGNFTIDSKYVVADVYEYLGKIYDLIGKYRQNYR